MKYQQSLRVCKSICGRYSGSRQPRALPINGSLNAGRRFGVDSAGFPELIQLGLRQIGIKRLATQDIPLRSRAVSSNLLAHDPADVRLKLWCHLNSP
jgi:hypothetical protein